MCSKAKVFRSQKLSQNFAGPLSGFRAEKKTKPAGLRPATGSSFSRAEKHLTLHLSGTAGCNAYAYGFHTFTSWPLLQLATICLHFGKRLSSGRRINSQVCNLVCGQFLSVWTGSGHGGGRASATFSTTRWPPKRVSHVCAQLNDGEVGKFPWEMGETNSEKRNSLKR